MKRFITFVMVFILGFFVVLVGVYAKAEVLPNEEAKEWEFEGLGINESFDQNDLGYGRITKYGTFNTNFNTDTFQFEITAYTILVDMVVETSEAPIDYEARPISLNINGVSIFNLNSTYFVTATGQNRYHIYLEETAPPGFSKSVTLSNNNNSYDLEFDISWDWFNYDVISANLQVYLYPSESSLANQLYWEGYRDGREYGFDKGYEKGYQEAKDEWYQIGKDDGYELGKQAGIDLSNDYSFAGLIGQVFVGLGSLLAINLLPGISLGAIIAVPVVFGIIAFILGKRGGKGD